MARKNILIFSLLFLESYAIENYPDRHIREFDSGKYRLEWLVDNSQERIFFNVTVQTLGFVGFGISKRENNGLIDLVIGGVDRGKAYFSDRNIKPPQTFFPEADKKQDWILDSSWESRTHTFLSFSRAFDTCDPEDVPFDDDTVTLHYIYGESDKVFEYFRAVHGSTPVYLRDPDLIPISLTTSNGQHPTEINGRKVSVWNINANRIIPANKTSYICTIKKLSLYRKHHILGFNVRINDESLPHIHHIVFNRCHVPSSMGTASSIFEPVLQTEELCYFAGNPNRKIRGAFCTDAKIGFAIGNGPTFFPDHLGLPIGESGEDEYFLMQVHYDNPQQRNDINSQLNLDIYHSPELRKNDGGILTIGANVPVPQSILIPPGEKNHEIYGRCSSRCTNISLPQTGIKMVAGFLHAHSAAKKLRLSHYRNGRELKYLMNDENYVNNYQPWRFNKEEVTILPGDEMTTRCSYDTTERDSSLVGGFATYQEMCVSFILYYGKIDFSFCGSDIHFSQYTTKNLAGASNFTWNEGKLEFVANAPEHLAGMTVSEISDSYVNWSREKRKELKMDHFALDQAEYCAHPGRNELAFLQARRTGQLKGLPANFVSYPRATPYIPERTCPRNDRGHLYHLKSGNYFPRYNFFPFK